MSFSYRGELVFFDSIDDLSLFYAPTLNLCIAGTPSLIEKMKGFLRNESSFPEFEELLSGSWNARTDVYDLTKVNSHYFHIALGLTENCTLACKYCHADAGKSTAMNKDIVVASAEYAKKQVIEKNLKGINLSFAVGGEPTFHTDLFLFATTTFRTVAKEINTELHISMTTNGYYDAPKAQLVANEVDNILLSLDGLEDIQNIHRPTRSGGESFKKVIQSLDIFFEKKQEISVRATVSTLSLPKMTELVDFLSDRYPGGNIALVFEPLVPLGRGANENENSITPPPNLAFAKKFWETYCYGQAKGLRISTSALNADRLVSGFCGAMFIPSFTVTTAGIVTTCERDSTGENYGYGKYDPETKSFILDTSAIEQNRKRVEVPKMCDECICRYHCAGDCPDVKTMNYSRCDVNTFLLKEYLKKKLAEKEVPK